MRLLQAIIFTGLFAAASNASSQMLEAGDGVVELGMGFPNFAPVVIDQAGVFHGGGFDIFDNGGKRFGQVCLKGEFLLSDRLGVIAAINYSFFSTHSTQTISEYDPFTQTYTDNTYYYDTRIHKWRITGGLNIHTVRTSRVDSYFGFMAGSKSVFMKHDTNDPAILGEPSAVVLPFALRIHYGFRYFINTNFAIHFEMGLGGPLLNAGVTYKFNKLL